MIGAAAYADAIELHVPFAPAPREPGAGGGEARREVLQWLLSELARSLPAPTSEGGIDLLIRDLLTIRRPGAVPGHVQTCLDELLAGQARARGSVSPSEILAAPGRLSIAGTPVRVWPGDITRLAVDALVNAANAELLGSFRPRHACIDNAIHGAAGPRLREDCARIIEIQGHPERSGEAKITRGYHLPSRFVLHTVGPIVVGGRVQPQDERLLAAAYVSCLDLARTIPSVRRHRSGHAGGGGSRLHSALDPLPRRRLHERAGRRMFLEEPYRPQMERWRAWFGGIPARASFSSISARDSTRHRSCVGRWSASPSGNPWRGS